MSLKSVQTNFSVVTHGNFINIQDDSGQMTKEKSSGQAEEREVESLFRVTVIGMCGGAMIVRLLRAAVQGSAVRCRIRCNGYTLVWRHDLIDQ